MIILYSGTSGSGKTFIVNRVMERLGAHDETLTFGPKRKLGGYVWHAPAVTIMGRYDATCGGCDSLSWKGASDDIERAVVEQRLGYSRRVILEGLLVGTWGIPRLGRLVKSGLIVVHLTTPVEECVASVEARRAARAVVAGKELKPFNPDNTVGKHHGLLSVLPARRAAGIPVECLSRQEALDYTLKALAP